MHKKEPLLLAHESLPDAFARHVLNLVKLIAETDKKGIYTHHVESLLTISQIIDTVHENEIQRNLESAKNIGESLSVTTSVKTLENFTNDEQEKD